MWLGLFGPMQGHILYDFDFDGWRKTHTDREVEALSLSWLIVEKKLISEIGVKRI